MTTIPNSDAIDAAYTTFMEAFNKRDIDTLLEMYTDDAVAVQPDGSHYAGCVEIRTWFTVLLDDTPDGETLDCQTESLFEAGAGTIVEGGRWKHVSEDGETQQRGNYVAVWCERDGRWQIHRDMILASGSG